jgi:hypothetical protein
MEFGVWSNSGSTFKGSKFKVKNSGRCSSEFRVGSSEQQRFNVQGFKVQG